MPRGIPLSGASRYRGAGHDVGLYPFGRAAAPLVAEVKSRKNGSGFTLLEKWLGEHQVLFLRSDRADPLVVLPWSTWETLLERRVVNGYDLSGTGSPRRIS
jgi:hypothetical protein